MDTEKIFTTEVCERARLLPRYEPPKYKAGDLDEGILLQCLSWPHLRPIAIRNIERFGLVHLHDMIARTEAATFEDLLDFLAPIIEADCRARDEMELLWMEEEYYGFHGEI